MYGRAHTCDETQRTIPCVPRGVTCGVRVDAWARPLRKLVVRQTLPCVPRVPRGVSCEKRVGAGEHTPSSSEPDRWTDGAAIPSTSFIMRMRLLYL